MTVRQLLAASDSDELSEWYAYHLLEPFGPLVEDMRHAVRCGIAAKADPAEFAYRPPAPEPGPEELAAKIKRAFGIT